MTDKDTREPTIEPRVTTSTDLMNRVRSNIYEATGADVHRTDAEIYQWLQDALHDYMAKLQNIPEEAFADAFPELLMEANVASFPWTIPADFAKLLAVHVVHSVGGESVTDVAFVMRVPESYMVLRQDASLGAWAQVQNPSTPRIAAGPNATTGLVKYRKAPTSILTPGSPVDFGSEHEDAIVNRATAFALQKINDQEADWYLKQYESRVMAEISKYMQKETVSQ